MFKLKLITWKYNYFCFTLGQLISQCTYFEEVENMQECEILNTPYLSLSCVSWIKKKLRIRETLNLSRFANSSTNYWQKQTETDKHGQTKSSVVSCVICWFGKTQKRIFQTAKNLLKQQKPKTSRGMPILAIRSLTRSLQYTGKRVFREGTHTHRQHTDIATYMLNWRMTHI